MLTKTKIFGSVTQPHAKVELYADGELLDTVTADASGAYAALHDMTVGTHTIQAIAAGTQSPEITLEVEPEADELSNTEIIAMCAPIARRFLRHEIDTDEAMAECQELGIDVADHFLPAVHAALNTTFADC